jgi:hypothetical protein
MSEKITLWYNVKGHSALDYVEILPEHTIAHLRTTIWEKRRTNVFSGIDAADLELYKVRRSYDTH